jgi:hypothetical protein
MLASRKKLVPARFRHSNSALNSRKLASDLISSNKLAKFTAILLASSRVSSLAAELPTAVRRTFSFAGTFCLSLSFRQEAAPWPDVR